jgi:hypothetical protein
VVAGAADDAAGALLAVELWCLALWAWWCTTFFFLCTTAAFFFFACLTTCALAAVVF